MGNYEVAAYYREQKKARAAFAARVQALIPGTHVLRIRTHHRFEPDLTWREITAYDPAGEYLVVPQDVAEEITDLFHTTYQPRPPARHGDWDVDVASVYPPAPIHRAPGPGEPGFIPADQGCFRIGVPITEFIDWTHPDVKSRQQDGGAA